MEWKHPDAAILKTRYETELQALTEALLSGASWQEVQDKRALLIQLSKQLDGLDLHHPAGHPTRWQSPPGEAGDEETR